MESRQHYVPKDRLTHIQSHIEDGIDKNAIKNIRNGTGSPSNSAASLGHFCWASGMNAWFASKDLSAMRVWFAERPDAAHVLRAPH